MVDLIRSRKSQSVPSSTAPSKHPEDTRQDFPPESVRTDSSSSAVAFQKTQDVEMEREEEEEEGNRVDEEEQPPPLALTGMVDL